MLDVLLVESSKAMVQVYKKMIPWEMYGFTIASVCDSEQQAISYFGEYSYALVICDLQLRQGGGRPLFDPQAEKSWIRRVSSLSFPNRRYS